MSADRLCGRCNDVLDGADELRWGVCEFDALLIADELNAEKVATARRAALREAAEMVANARSQFLEPQPVMRQVVWELLRDLADRIERMEGE